jgi:tellurium resistance protein TerD
MSINLTKSSTISLEKIDPSLKNIHVGLGWDAEDSNGNEIDCDVSVFMIDGNNKIPQDGFFVFL